MEMYKELFIPNFKFSHLPNNFSQNLKYSFNISVQQQQQKLVVQSI